MNNFSLEKPSFVFIRVPEIQDICLEYGIDCTDKKMVSAMYEVFKRVTSKSTTDWSDEIYDEGYDKGFQDALDKAESKADELAWEIRNIKK